MNQTIKSFVSIIIPTFNGLPWLEDAIKSAINQTHKNCEIIIIDDGSNDGTSIFIKDNYKEKVNYYFQDNQGLASARNLGLKYAKGEFIQFLDSDDLLTPEKIKNHYNFLCKNPNIDVVYSDCKTFSGDDLNKKNKWKSMDLYRNGKIFLNLVQESFILPHMPLSRKKILVSSGGYDTSLSSCIDYEFWLRIASANRNFYFLNDNTYVLYRIREESLSSSSTKFATNGLYSLKKFKYIIDTMDENAQKIYNNAIGDWIFKKGKSLHESRKYFLGITNMVKGIFKSRVNFQYKICFLFLAIFFSAENSDKILKNIKTIKGYFLR